MFDRWGRHVDWPETSGVGDFRVEGQVVVNIGDEQHCRDLLATAFEELRQPIEECDRIEVADGPAKYGRSGMVPWHGGPRLYEELYWDCASSGWFQRRRTPGLNLQAYVHRGDNSTELGNFRTTLTIAVDGVACLGSVPATSDNLRNWFAQVRAEEQKSWDEVSGSRRIFRLFRRQRPRGGGQQGPNTQESQAERQLFLRNFDVDFQSQCDDDLDLFGGQPISKTGDEQRCRQRLSAAAANLTEAMRDCESHIWPVGGPRWLRDRLRARLRVKAPKPEGGKAGMLPRWDGGPRLYEELYWEPNSVDRVHPWSNFAGRVHFWSQNRHTPGLEIQVSLPGELDSGSERRWRATLTVSDDGITELGSVPATPDNLRDWFVQCVAEMPSVPRPETLGRPRADGQIISRSSGADLVLARKKLLEARRLLHEEIELRSRQGSDHRPRLHERAGTIEHPGIISWNGSPRLFEEAYWWQGDLDSDDPWDECTRTLGYRWEYGPMDSSCSHTDILMTVSTSQTVEFCVSRFASSCKAEACPATIENFRNILDR